MRDLELQRDLLDAVQRIVAGTEHAPPGAGIVTECVVVMGWVADDGDHGRSHVRCGSPWGTEGLLIAAIREIEAAEQAQLDDDFSPEDDDDA